MSSLPMPTVDQEYVALLHKLSRAAEKEVASSLAGRPPGREILKAMDAVVSHRAVEAMIQEAQGELPSA